MSELVERAAMVLPGAANRDPRQFHDPGEFRVGRTNSRDQIGFGRGAHACPGGPPPRVG